jgi:hypothetical protein
LYCICDLFALIWIHISDLQWLSYFMYWTTWWWSICDRNMYRINNSFLFCRRFLLFYTFCSAQQDAHYEDIQVSSSYRCIGCHHCQNNAVQLMWTTYRHTLYYCCQSNTCLPLLRYPTIPIHKWILYESSSLPCGRPCSRSTTDLLWHEYRMCRGRDFSEAASLRRSFSTSNCADSLCRCVCDFLSFSCTYKEPGRIQSRRCGMKNRRIVIRLPVGLLHFLLFMGSRTIPDSAVSYPINTECSFSEGKAVGAWCRPFTSC